MSLKALPLAAAWGAAALLLGACANNTGLALPRAGGPIPTSAPNEPTDAEKAFWEALEQVRVIYIGETHTSNADHEYEFDVLKGLKMRGVNFAIGWEMFDVTQQALLDEWRTRALTTDALLDKTDWRHTWGAHSVMYEKMLRWSEGEGVDSVALNAPSSLSRKLAHGLPLTPEERAMVPSGYSPLPGGLEHFNEQMTQNPHAGAAANLENFYRAQLLWEQTMAMRIVEFIDAHPDEHLVVLCGRGHVEGGFGVPAFVRQKTNARQLVLFPGGSPSPDGAGRLARGTILSATQACWITPRE